jgi:hypothetical protein
MATGSTSCTGVGPSDSAGTDGARTSASDFATARSPDDHSLGPATSDSPWREAPSENVSWLSWDWVWRRWAGRVI